MNRGDVPHQIDQSSKPDASQAVCDVGWYHPGQSRSIEFGGLQVTVRFVARKGRRGRIAITATVGNGFRASSKEAI